MGVALLAIGNTYGITPGLTAGAIISGGQGSATDKIAAMENAGIKVAASPAALGSTLVEVLKG